MRLIDYFDRGADLFPQRDCLHDGTRGWTYADVRATTHRVANGLLAAGLKSGDKVAVYSPNHAMAYAALLVFLVPITIVLNTFFVINRFRQTVDVGLQREIKAQIRATLPGIGVCIANEQVLGTTIGFRGLGMPAPSRLSFEVDDSGRAAGLVAWRGEAIGTIVTELAPTIGGSKVRAYGSLELRGSDGSTGRVRLDRDGLLVAEVVDPGGDSLRLSAPLK